MNTFPVARRMDVHRLYWECYSNFIGIDYQAWTRLYVRLLNRYDPRAEYAVLDFGCGSGLSALSWRTIPCASRVVGFDIDKKQVEISKSRGIAAYSSLRVLRARRCSFDAVVAYNDVPNMIRPADLQSRFLRASMNLLNPGGVVIFDFLTPAKFAVANVDPICFDEWKIVQKTIPSENGFERIQIQFYYRDHLVRRVIEHLFPIPFIRDQLKQAGYARTYMYDLRTEIFLRSQASDSTRLVCVGVKPRASSSRVFL